MARPANSSNTFCVDNISIFQIRLAFLAVNGLTGINATKFASSSLKSILRINPFHVPSLLLLADIKSKEGRLTEAKKFVEKAIEIDKKSSIGFVQYGQILLREYLNTENDDYLDGARNAFQNALSLQPSNKEANKYMGFISLKKQEYERAINFFKTIQKHHRSSEIAYSMAISYDMTDNNNMALKSFLKSYKSRPSDSVLRSRIEDFLIFRNYKMGHPARIMLNKELMELANKRSNRNLSYETMVYLRRALLLNPMNSKARELLLNYYSVMGYYRFYIDEVKELLKMFPGKKYRDILSVEISKRRKHLYHKEGYSEEMPSRSVPRVLVLNFYSDDITFHPDAGEMIGSYLTFVLKQFGRMEVVGIKKRREISKGLKTAPDHIESSINKLHDMVKYGKIPSFNYIIYGKYNEHGSKISSSCKLVDFRKGFIISDFNLSMGGKESLPGLSLRIAKKIYDTIPFSGKVLKLKSKGIVVNLGLFDDISKGDKFIIKKFSDSIINGKLFNKSIVFKVKEANTLISYAEPENIGDLEAVDYEDIVYPFNKIGKK